MQWVLIDRVGHLAFYVLTKISGLNSANSVTQEVRHFSTVKTVEAEIDSPPVTVSGWTVDGWREDETAAAHTITSNGTVRMTGDKTIYAIYRRNATFYSGVNKASSATARQYYNTTNKYSLTTLGSSSVTAIDGFTSKGWVSSGGTNVAFETKYTGSAKAFYARYQRTATFYHGVNKAANTTATQTYTSDDKYTVTSPAISKATAIDTWTAVDWLQKDDDIHVESAGAYTGSNNVFYAYYQRNITITYDANGGTGTTANTTGTQYYDSSNVITPSGIALAENAFTRTGYNFSKWDLGNPGATVPFAVGDPSSKTAKAQWSGYTYTVTYKQGTATAGYSASTYANQTGTYPTPITLHTNNMEKSDTEKPNSKFTITFNANGGTCGTSSLSTYIPIAYTKNGWTTTSGSTTRNYANAASYTNSAEDNSTLTLYPCFSQTDRGRTSITMPTPSKTNYTCTGWFDSTASTATKLYSCGVSYTNVAKSQTVYAQWTNADKRITFSNVAVCVPTSAKKPDGAVQTFKKAVYNVTFSFKAAMTWQQMVDNSTYKWPTAFSGKIGSGAYSFPNPQSFNYTTRSAVQAGSDDCYLQTTTRNDLDGTLVFFPGYSALNNTTVYAAYTYYYQLICDNNTVSGSASNIPADPTLAGDTISVGSTYYMTSGSNTDATVKDNGNFTFRQGT